VTKRCTSMAATVAVAVVPLLAACAQGGASAERTPAASPSGPAYPSPRATPPASAISTSPTPPERSTPSATRTRPAIPAPSPTARTQPPATKAPTVVFSSSVSVITPAIRARMPYSWRPGCPVGLGDLRYLTVSYRGFDRAVHRGELVVSAGQTDAVLAAMRSLFYAGFPVRQMRLVDVYHADDNASIAADNTSAFNCREVAGRPGVWSQHSYGVAIDVNPLENPYVAADGTVSPPAGRAYVDRSRQAPGMIHTSDSVVDAFAGSAGSGAATGPRRRTTSTSPPPGADPAGG